MFSDSRTVVTVNATHLPSGDTAGLETFVRRYQSPGAKARPWPTADPAPTERTPNASSAMRRSIRTSKRGTQGHRPAEPETSITRDTADGPVGVGDEQGEVEACHESSLAQPMRESHTRSGVAGQAP